MIYLDNEMIASIGRCGEYIVEGTPNQKMVAWEMLSILEADGCYVEFNGKKGVITNIDWEPHGEMTFMIDEDRKGSAPGPAALVSFKQKTIYSAANIPNANGSSTATATVPVGALGQTIGISGVLGQNYLISGGSTITPGVVGYTLAKPQSDSPDLPDIVLKADDEYGRAVEITLSPDSNLSTQEALKIMMLMMAFVSEPEAFNVLNYIKKNNIERHFKYA